MMWLPSSWKKKESIRSFDGFGVVLGGVIQLVVQIPFVIKKNLDLLNLTKFYVEPERVVGRVGIGTIGLQLLKSIFW